MSGRCKLRFFKSLKGVRYCLSIKYASLAILSLIAACDRLPENSSATKERVSRRIENKISIHTDRISIDQYNRYYYNNGTGAVAVMFVSKNISIDRLIPTLCADHMPDRTACERAKTIVRDFKLRSLTWIDTPDDFPAIRDGGCWLISFSFSLKTDSFTKPPECN